KPNLSVSETAIKAIFKCAAQLWQLLGGVIHEIVGLGPNNWFAAFDNHQGFGKNLRRRKFDRLGSRADSALTHDGAIERLPFFDLDTGFWCEELRHLVDKFLVVLAVPGLVEMESQVKLVLLDVGQDGHAPAQSCI